MKKQQINIIDLTEDYLVKILKFNDQVAYERLYPALFSHYFKYWARSKKFSNPLSNALVLKRKRMLTEVLKEIEEEISSAGLEMNNINIVIFVGQGTSNGHAFSDGEKFKVWLPLEGYETELQMRIFITHEIIHALHYSQSPEYYFHNIPEKRSIIRQLITEGIATWLSMKILHINEGEALWADYIPTSKIESWLHECRQKESTLYKFVLKNFNSSNPKIGIFDANNQSDIFKYRAGYYVGLKLIEAISKEQNITSQELLKIPRRKFENMTKKWLQKISA